jgi:cellobiose-specific phosphotransferase system component IIB
MKTYEIENVLRKIKSKTEYAINQIDHYRYGELDCKKVVNTYINLIDKDLQEIKTTHLQKFLFLDV